jgi:glycerophosphoryl diester phosphodiesterase
VRVFAHRGASAACPENTLAAFRAAVAMGADGVELDVRRTVDGALAVHHDPRLADGRLLLDVAAADLPPHVPLLDEALDACGDLVVNIEIKNLTGDPDHDPTERLAAAVVAEVGARAMHGRALVSSFNLATVDRVRELDPSVPTALLTVAAPVRPMARRLVERCLRHGHGAIHPHHAGLDRHLLRLAHEAGLLVNTWTVDDPGRIAQLAGLGVDGVVTNVPDVALRALER